MEAQKELLAEEIETALADEFVAVVNREEEGILLHFPGGTDVRVRIEFLS